MALLSLLSRRPARRNVALSGELTLSGAILPVSGIREKVLAAQRAGVKTVIFPKRNKVEVDEMEPDLWDRVQIILADEVHSILDIVLLGADS